MQPILSGTARTTGNWSTNTNWDTDTAPDNSGTITIGSGNTVTYDSSDFFLSNATLDLDGELTRAGVLRLKWFHYQCGFYWGDLRWFQGSQ